MFVIQGVVVIENFFKPEELEPCKKTIEDLVDKLAQKLLDNGKITSKTR